MKDLHSLLIITIQRQHNFSERYPGEARVELGAVLDSAKAKLGAVLDSAKPNWALSWTVLRQTGRCPGLC